MKFNKILDLLVNNSKFEKLKIIKTDDKTFKVFLFENNKKIEDRIIESVSYSTLLLSKDKKLILCSRKKSFLFQFLMGSVQKKQPGTIKIINKYSRLLKDSEVEKVKKKYPLCKNLSTKSFKEIMLPGGRPNLNELVCDCIKREVGEEIKVFDLTINFDKFCFVASYDVYRPKTYFFTLMFISYTGLTSEEILNNFSTTEEVDDIIVLDIVNNSKNSFIDIFNLLNNLKK